MTCLYLSFIKNRGLDLSELSFLIKKCKYSDKVSKFLLKRNKQLYEKASNTEPKNLDCYASCNGVIHQIVKEAEKAPATVQEIPPPPEIQKYAIEHENLWSEQLYTILDILSNIDKYDRFVVAPTTGSGKTYALSIIARMLSDKNYKTVVITPIKQHQRQWERYGFYPLYGKREYKCPRILEAKEKFGNELSRLGILGIKDDTCLSCPVILKYIRVNNEVVEFMKKRIEESCKDELTGYVSRYCRDCPYYLAIQRAKNLNMVVTNFANFSLVSNADIVIIDEYPAVKASITSGIHFKISYDVNREKKFLSRLQAIANAKRLEDVRKQLEELVLEIDNLKELLTIYRIFSRRIDKSVRDKILKVNIPSSVLAETLKEIETLKREPVVENLKKELMYAWERYTKTKDVSVLPKYVLSKHRNVGTLKQLLLNELLDMCYKIKEWVYKNFDFEAETTREENIDFITARIIAKDVKEFLADDIVYARKIDYIQSTIFDMFTIGREQFIWLIQDTLNFKKIFLVSATPEDDLKGFIVVPINPKNRCLSYNPKKNPIVYIPLINIKHAMESKEVEKEMEKVVEFIDRLGFHEERFLVYTYNFKYSKIFEKVIRRKLGYEGIVRSEDSDLRKSIDEFKENKKLKYMTLVWGDELGTDLNPNELDVRLLFVVKIPFPNLASIDQEFLVREVGEGKLMEENIKEAARRLIQLTGRHKRNPYKETITFIFDKAFDWGVRKYCLQDEEFKQRFISIPEEFL